MSRHRSPFVLAAAVVTVAAALAACGGGGGGGGTGGGVPPPVPTPTPTPVTSQQVVTMALPTSVMGSRLDPTFGLIGGYTQQTYSQVLAFAPGSQIMVHNGQGATPHTLGVVSTTAFDSGAALNTSATGGSTISSGFNTGTVLGGADAGPFTLAAGTYYIGCAFHYASNAMRTVLLVAAGATPGPQATPPVPNATPSPGKTGY